MSCMQKYLIGFFILTVFSAMAFAGGEGSISFPTPLENYGDDEILENKGLMAVLSYRINHAPFNLWASIIFLCAILHTFVAGKITAMAKKMEHAHVVKMRDEGKSEAEIKGSPPVSAEMLHFLGEIEAIFGIWVLVLAGVTVSFYDWATFKDYISYNVNYTEAMFVVVIMALASTRPIMQLAKKILGFFADIGKQSPGAWWLSILTIAPLLGSFITEPAAMTIGAMLLAEQFYRL